MVGGAYRTWCPLVVWLFNGWDAKLPGVGRRILCLPVLICMGACGSPGSMHPGAGGGAGDAGVTTDAGSTGGGSGGGSAVVQDAGPVMMTTLGAMVDADLSLSGVVRLSGDTIIAKGVKLTLAAGTTVIAEPAKGLEVRGSLVVEGTRSAPVRFTSASATLEWAGITIAGGSTTLRNVEIQSCTVAFTAYPASQYDVQGIDVTGCSSALSLNASGTIRYGTFHSLGVNQHVAPVVMSNASTILSDVLIDNANTTVDMIRVSGGSPQFDQLEITQGHCAFHFDSGTGINITNTYVHNTSYMLMVLGALGTKLSHNNIIGNEVNIGSCATGSAVPAGNYVSGPLYDDTCTGQAGDSSQAATPWADTGPRPRP
jgi:hypothetical protein